MLPPLKFSLSCFFSLVKVVCYIYDKKLRAVLIIDKKAKCPFKCNNVVLPNVYTRFN